MLSHTTPLTCAAAAKAFCSAPERFLGRWTGCGHHGEYRAVFDIRAKAVVLVQALIDYSGNTWTGDPGDRQRRDICTPDEQ